MLLFELEKALQNYKPKGVILHFSVSVSEILKRLHCSIEFPSNNLVELVSSVFKLMDMVKGVAFPKHAGSA